MRLAVVLLIGLLAAACGPANATTKGSVDAMPEAPLLASEGGLLRPIDNGGRVPLRSGYAIVRFTPSPQDMDPMLQLSVYDTAGAAVAADVKVTYEMVDMDHGTETATLVLRDGSYQKRLSFGMPGAWRVLITVARGGGEETIRLVLPWIGL